MRVYKLSLFGLISLSIAIGLLACFNKTEDQTLAKPNVLMIAVDDLNHWVGHLGRNKQAITPNIDRLAARGMSFHRAYAPAAICNATRTSMLSGIRPHRSGVYMNRPDWRSVVGPGFTLPDFFREQGYYVAGGGKLFHHAKIREGQWDFYYDKNNRYQLEDHDASQEHATLALGYRIGAFEVEEMAGRDDVLSDYHVARWAADELMKKHDKPFFIAAGIFRPHLPWMVPKKYFDLFPEQSIELPPYKKNDLDDLPNHGVAKNDHVRILEQGEGAWKRAIRAYLASMAYADRQVGRILDALDSSPYRDNTIVVLWGDHGWHFGEKHWWRKARLWEESTRTPYIWVVPGVTKPGSKTETAVDLQSLWPSLAELIDARLPMHVDGASIKTLLDSPDAVWSVPALTTQGFNNHAIRFQQYRYIRYNNGAQELYDHANDPYEWTNLAGRKEHQATIAKLNRWIPRLNRTSDDASVIFKGESRYAQ